MTPPTKQFTWKDRDTAAHDLLRVAYHAPPSVALQALNLLQAIRSQAIVPELVAIIEDQQREIWQRIYALCAIAATSGNWHLPQLQSEMIRILQKRAAIIANHPRPERAYFGIDLLDEIGSLAAHHPSNRTWFFTALDGATSPYVVRGFLTTAINSVQPAEFREVLIEALLKLLSSHPEQIDLSVIRTLVSEENPNITLWLHQRTDNIVEKLASDIRDPDVFSIVEQWEDMRIQLAQIDQHFEQAFNAYLVDRNERWQKTRTRRKETLTDYHSSPAYKHLFALYEGADNGDQQAYQQLVRVARRWQGTIPLRAVATRMLGKLRHRHEVTGVLCELLKYAQDDWDNDLAPLSPVRSEAGEALKDIPSPNVWTDMIDAFFINPRNVLASFMIDWIAHVTDMLEGLSTAYADIGWGKEEERSWFRALAEISDDQLQLEIGSS